MSARSQPAGPGEIDFHKIFHIFRKSRRLLLTTTLLALLAALLYLFITPRVYVSEAIVQVQQPASALSTTPASGGDDFSSIESLRTIEQNLNSLSLMRRLVDKPDLGLTPARLGFPPRQAPYTSAEKANVLATRVHAELQRGTRLIRIFASDEDPVTAQRIAEAVVTEYRARLVDDQQAVAEETNRALLEEAARQKSKLQKSEEALQAYKESTQAVSLEESQNIIVGQLKDLNTRFAEAQGERLRFESAVGALAQMTDRSGENLLSISAISSDPAVLDQKRALADLEAEFANLKQRYLSKHPKYIQVQSQLAQLRGGVNRAALGAAERIGTIYATAQATEQKFAVSLQEQEKKALELNKMAITYNVLQRDVDSDRALFDAVLKRLKEADASKGFEQDNVRLVDAATLPNHADKPKKKVVLAGALLAGLLLGTAIAGSKQLFDTSLPAVDEAEQALQLPVLAAIPFNESAEENSPAIIHDSGGLVAEGFRTLRTALMVAKGNELRQVTLFTSALPGEGKTFCSVNYAASVAQQGHKTLLIDADLRLPGLHKLFFENENPPGLSDYLRGSDSLTSACRDTKIPDLAVMTAGTRLGNASELLSSTRMQELITEAQERFDRIIIDTAPVNAVSDALLIAGLAQTICLVVRAGETPRKASRYAIRKLTEAGHAPIGFILNRISTNSGPGYYYHYGTGTYGSGNYGRAVYIEPDLPEEREQRDSEDFHFPPLSEDKMPLAAKKDSPRESTGVLPGTAAEAKESDAAKTDKDRPFVKP